MFRRCKDDVEMVFERNQAAKSVVDVVDGLIRRVRELEAQIQALHEGKGVVAMNQRVKGRTP